MRETDTGDWETEMGKEEQDSFCRKKDRLLKRMAEYAETDIIVAFSGGVDSSLLLKLACEAAGKTGKRVYGITVQTRMHPIGEMEEARKIAEETGAEHMSVFIDELKEAGITENPIDRCYRCKRHLFGKIKERAKEMNVPAILEGTNEDDLHVYRPGIKALKELRIASPLAEVHMTKEQVRQMAAEYGLSVAAKPAAPCLATRFPYGTTLTYEKIRQAEKGEGYLKSLGLGNVRLRVHGNVARIEADTGDFPKIMAQKDHIAGFLKRLGYTYITLDLEGFRSGSMDIDIMHENMVSCTQTTDQIS